MKRAIDLVVALLVLILASPLLLLVGLAIRVRMGRPVFFTQLRPGLHGRPFRLVKFRTMATCSDARVGDDAARLTPLGSFLRAASLDELPQMWNILVGDMSLVGPRPLLMQYLDRYSPEQARRHEVRPGITGWAQVNGRNGLSWPEKFALDLWYVDNHNLRVDLRILAMTVLRVLGRSDIAAEGSATMPEFAGNEDKATGVEIGPSWAAPESQAKRRRR